MLRISPAPNVNPRVIANPGAHNTYSDAARSKNLSPVKNKKPVHLPKSSLHSSQTPDPSIGASTPKSNPGVNSSQRVKPNPGVKYIPGSYQCVS